MTSIVEHQPFAGSAGGALPLPERLEHFGSVIFAADAVAGIIAIVLCGALFHAAIAAFFMMTAAIAIAAAVGRYRVSFAVDARDEWYACAGVAAPAAVAGALLCAAFGFAWWAALAAALVWAAIAGYLSTRLHRARRAGTQYAGMLLRVRTTPRSVVAELEQGIIRALDVLLACIGIALLLPVMLVVALAVLIDDGGPALFGQRRVGRDDREFMMMKVRTMRRDAGAAWVSREGDPRITRVGGALRRSSLDELPQLFNVVRGEMSLVGPRPEMHEYAAQFTRRYENYWQRHRVRPGITGWAQLYLPRTLTPEDAPTVLRYDLFYVEHAGVYLYLQCLMKTAAEIVVHKAL